MLKTLVRIACSSAVLVPFILNAKEVPIVKQLTVLVPYKEFSVIEFPFEIKGHDFTPFVSVVKEMDGVLPENDSVPDLVVPKLDTKNALPPGSPVAAKSIITPSNNTKKTPLEVTKGKNFIKLFPKKVGDTELIVWGYSKFPIMLKIKVTEEKDRADKLITFVDYDEQKQEAGKFESSYHDKNVVNITKALYNNEVPKGYTEIIKQKEIISDTLKFILIREYQGKQYSGQEYLVTNIGTQNIILDYDIFRGQKGLYGVTFTHDILEPQKQTRLFIIKQRNVDE